MRGRDCVRNLDTPLAGGVRTPIALHCGSSIFNMAMKAVEIGRFD